MGEGVENMPFCRCTIWMSPRQCKALTLGVRLCKTCSWHRPCIGEIRGHPPADPIACALLSLQFSKFVISHLQVSPKIHQENFQFKATQLPSTEMLNFYSSLNDNALNISIKCNTETILVPTMQYAPVNA